MLAKVGWNRFRSSSRVPKFVFPRAFSILLRNLLLFPPQRANSFYLLVMVLCFFCSSHLIGPKLYFTLPSLFSGAFSDLRLKNGKNSAPLQKPLPPKGWSAPKQRLGGKQKPRFSQSGGSSQKSMNLQWPKNLSKSNRG